MHKLVHMLFDVAHAYATHISLNSMSGQPGTTLGVSLN